MSIGLATVGPYWHRRSGLEFRYRPEGAALLEDIQAIRIKLQFGQKVRDLALFNLAIDSKLRACDLAKLRISDVSHGAQMASRAMVMQQKTGRPV